MRRSTPRIVPHHFKPRACLCLLSQCCAFRKAERVPRCVGTSCWSSGHSKSATFAFFTWECAFPRFCFRLSVAQRRRRGRNERCTARGVASNIAARQFWFAPAFFFLCRSLTADVRECLEPVEAAPPSFAISFCVEKQWSARLFSTAVISSWPPHSSGHQCL